MNTPMLVIDPSGEYYEAECNYENIRRGTDGCFDFVSPSPEVGLFVNDMGLLNMLPLNIPVTMLIGRPLYGPCVLTHGDSDSDGETLPPTPEVLKLFKDFADRWHCAVLAAEDLGQSLMIRPDSRTVPSPLFIPLDDGDFDNWLKDGTIPKAQQ